MEAVGGEAQEGGDICILMADHVVVPAEANNIVKQFSSQLKKMTLLVLHPNLCNL